MRIQQVVYVRIQFKGPQAPHSTFLLDVRFSLALAFERHYPA